MLHSLILENRKLYKDEERVKGVLRERLFVWLQNCVEKTVVPRLINCSELCCQDRKMVLQAREKLGKICSWLR